MQKGRERIANKRIWHSGMKKYDEWDDFPSPPSLPNLQSVFFISACLSKAHHHHGHSLVTLTLPLQNI